MVGLSAGEVRGGTSVVGERLDSTHGRRREVEFTRRTEAVVGIDIPFKSKRADVLPQRETLTSGQPRELRYCARASALLYW